MVQIKSIPFAERYAAAIATEQRLFRQASEFHASCVSTSKALETEYTELRAEMAALASEVKAMTVPATAEHHRA